MNIINLNGGDLGRAEYCTELHMIPMTIELIAELLDRVRLFIPRESILSHAIEFNPVMKTVVQTTIDNYKKKLPPSVEFYEVDGQTIFDVRSASGGIVNRNVFYIVTKKWTS